MDLDRHSIERRDFSAARRGYDPDEVDQHLRDIAASIVELKQSQAAPSVAGAAADQVRTIVEAAEQSAAEIQQTAEQEASRITDDAARQARETRERADSEAASHVQKVEEATGRMQERASKVQSEVDTLIENIRSTADGLVESLRSGSGTLRSDLESLRSELSDVRAARPDVFEQPAPDLGDNGGAAVADTEPSVDDLGATDTSAAAEEEAVSDYDVDDFAPTSTETPSAVDEPDAEVEEPEVVGQTPDTDFGGGTVTEEPAFEEQTEVEAEPAPSTSTAGSEGARLIALNMALNGTPRDETARYLTENFDLADQDAILDEVYERAGGA